MIMKTAVSDDFPFPDRTLYGTCRACCLAESETVQGILAIVQ